ncbi:MAG: hypothetical protein KBA31_12900 [Alphaproteobacteria bacterium]|nr:hypothetical protein [Alphaproteobacteria bacterium]
MPRGLSLIYLVLLLATAGVSRADVPDSGPPYTDQQFLALAPERLPIEFRNPKRLSDWWARAPAYLRQHMLNSKSEMWWPIIQCNYMGYKPNEVGDLNSAKCERQSYENSQRGKKNWSPDGQWIGPSEECRKRDKRSQWGELICD